jgi:hypothetical protein
VTPAQARTLRLMFGATTRRRLAHARKVSLTLRLVVHDKTGSHVYRVPITLTR